MTTIEQTHEDPTNLDADAIVIGIWKSSPLTQAAKQIDEACDGRISSLIELGEISSEPFAVSRLLSLPGIASPLVLMVGLGDPSSPLEGLAWRAAGTAAKSLATKARERVGFYLDLQPVEHAVCGMLLGCVGQDIYRQKKELFPLKHVLWANGTTAEIEAGNVLGRSVNLTRQLVNLPASEIYPETFAEHCSKTAEANNLQIEVWDEAKLQQERCGAMLAVARGSSKPPRLVIMKYNGGTSDQQPIALVGKGVTFDSGGLSLKPSEGMFDMKCDMAGAATVLGTINAVAQLKLPINVIGLMGLAENMVSGDSYKLGDVLTSRNGKTIEVHNTDAEGRLVLADTLDVAREQGAGKIIDLATLTGACMVALGKHTVGVMTNQQTFCDEFLAACHRAGEAAWQLPMFSEFAKQIQSKVADIKNVGDGRWGGAITAGKFLEEFVGDTPWIHIDIAGPSFQETAKSWVDAGASGCMVLSLIHYLRGET